MKISRRNFLKGSATTLFLAGFNFPILASTDKKKNLVVIMLRGGMDGLCAVPIIGDKNFEKRRKDLILDQTIKLYKDSSIYQYCTIGGDGSLNSLINALMFNNISMPEVSVLPAGSGSDFIRTFAIPQNIEEWY